MRSVITALFILIFIPLFFSCKKELNGTESDLYGVWVKGSNMGDTLWIMRKNGQNIIRVPESFNPLLPIYSEKEYRLNDRALSIKLFAPTIQDYSPITSFTWTDPGKEFTIESTQLFMFMSSIVTLKYKKI